MSELPSIEPNPELKGGYRFENTEVGIGAVLAVRLGDQMLFVQKALKKGYEFSDLWALPGGMLRLSEPCPKVPSDNDLRTFLAERVEKESGIKVYSDAIVKLSFVPPITTYTPNGFKRWTVVIPFTATLTEVQTPKPNDRSIQAAKWQIPIEILPHCAPANQLIVAQIERGNWNCNQIKQIEKHVDEATSFCSEAAMVAGFPAYQSPFSKQFI